MVELVHQKRPYWYVDAKWVCGIIFSITLAWALLANTMAVITSPTNGVEFSATLIASLFSREGLDAREDLTELKQQAAASADGTIAPIPSFPNVTVDKSDLETLTPRQLRLKIFRQIARPIYEKGLEGAAEEVTNDPAQIEQFKQDGFFLSFFTLQTHKTLAAWATLATVIAALAGAGVAYFSWGWGRLANPGAILLLTSLPGALISLMLKYAPSNKDNGGPLSMIPPDLWPGITSAMSASYSLAAVVGALALVGAGIGRIVTSRRKSK